MHFVDYQRITHRNYTFSSELRGKIHTFSTELRVKNHTFLRELGLVHYGTANGIDDVRHVLIADHRTRGQAHSDFE